MARGSNNNRFRLSAAEPVDLNHYIIAHDQRMGSEVRAAGVGLGGRRDIAQQWGEGSGGDSRRRLGFSNTGSCLGLSFDADTGVSRELDHSRTEKQLAELKIKYQKAMEENGQLKEKANEAKEVIGEL